MRRTCLSVCLFARLPISGTCHVSGLYRIFVACYLRLSSGGVMYVFCTCGLEDDVMFARNRLFVSPILGDTPLLLFTYSPRFDQIDLGSGKL